MDGDPPTTVEIRSGDERLGVLRVAGLRIVGACSGMGRCGTCAVHVSPPAPAPTPADRRLLSRESLASGVRLGCTLPPGRYTLSSVRPLPAVAKTGPAHLMAERLLPGPEGPGIAVDIGTTTVMSCAFDNTGRPGPVYHTPNLQRRFGADVMSRISAARDVEVKAALKAAAVESIAAVVDRARADLPSTAWIAAVGNTIMHHLAAGLDTTPLGVRPFAPRPSGYRWATVSLPSVGGEQPLKVTIVPPLGGLVGSDLTATVAVLMRTHQDSPWLAIDMGTNCEIALWRDRRLRFASVPAGPAFEGWGLSWGCTACDGAVEHVDTVNGVLSLTVRGGGEPVGLCGSAAVDLCALLRIDGRLETSGRLVSAQRLVLAPNGLSFSQSDVREIQKAKAAVEIGVRAILTDAPMEAHDLRCVALSGAFSKGLHLGHAQAIGLIPSVAAERLMVAGNTALLGAGFCLDRSLVHRIRCSGRRVLLNTEGFTERFAEAVQLRPWA